MEYRKIGWRHHYEYYNRKKYMDLSVLNMAFVSTFVETDQKTEEKQTDIHREKVKETLVMATVTQSKFTKLNNIA